MAAPSAAPRFQTEQRKHVSECDSQGGSAPITPGFAGIRRLQYAHLEKAEGKPMPRALKNDILLESYGLFLQGRTLRCPFYFSRTVANIKYIFHYCKRRKDKILHRKRLKWGASGDEKRHQPSHQTSDCGETLFSEIGENKFAFYTGITPRRIVQPSYTRSSEPARLPALSRGRGWRTS